MILGNQPFAAAWPLPDVRATFNLVGGGRVDAATHLRGRFGTVAEAN